MAGKRGAAIQFSLEPIAGLTAVEALWRQLEAASDVSFFVSWTWIGTWLRSLPARIRPLLLAASQDGETIAAAILVERRQRRRIIIDVKQLHFNATGEPDLDCITIEHNGFVGPSSPDLWRSFLAWFAQTAEADELLVPGISSGLIDVTAQSEALLHTVIEQPCFASSLLTGGLDGILGRLSGNARQQLRRNMRALGDLRVEVAATPEQALEIFAALKDLHIRSWNNRGKPHAFRQPFFEQFHRALIRAGLTDGSVQLLRISAGAEVLGYLYNFGYRGRICAYQSGFDDAKNAFRPGYVAHVLAMEQSFRDGAGSYDFLAGDNRLKRTLGHVTSVMGWHRFSKPRLLLKLEAAVRSAVLRVRRQ